MPGDREEAGRKCAWLVLGWALSEEGPVPCLQGLGERRVAVGEGERTKVPDTP